MTIKNFELHYCKNLQQISQNLTHEMRCKHAAMLTIKGKIVSIGVNKAKSDPLQKEYARLSHLTWRHAEVDCLKSVKHLNMSKATLFVVRTDQHGNLSESCPCIGCQRLIDKLQIPRIIYSISNGSLLEMLR